jgi:hypothetical protein
MAVPARAALLSFVLLVGAAGIGWLAFDLGRAPEGVAPPDVATGPEGAPALAGRAGNPEGAPGDPGALRGAAAPAAEATRAGRGLGVVRGIVRSGRTHEPVPGATVTLLLERGKVPDGLAVERGPATAVEARTDAAGRFAVEGLARGAWRVTVRHPEEGVDEAVAVASPSPAWLGLYPMPERPEGRAAFVRVVDEAHAPVAGARVECECRGTEPIVGETDADGRVRLDGVPFVEDTARGWITASAPGGIGRVPLRLELWRGPGEPRVHEIVLRQGGAIEGRLVAPGAALAGARVEAWSLEGGRGTWANGVARSARSDEAGRFRFDGLPAGAFALLAHPPAGLRMDLAPTEVAGALDWAPLAVEVAPGATTSVVVPLVPGGAIRGRVVTTEGAPVAACRVEAHLPQGPGDYVERVTRGGVPLWRLDSAWPDERRFPLSWRVLTTGADGRYEASGLLPGPWRVRAVPPGPLAFDRQEPVLVADGAVAEVEHVVGPGGTLEMTSRPFDSLGLRRRGAASVSVSVITPQGALAAMIVPGLAVGDWEVVQLHSDESIAPVPLAAFEIRAGEVTYVDVSEAGDTRVTVRVLDRGVPVAGAMLSHPGQRGASETDAEGEVTWVLTRFGTRRTVWTYLTPPAPGAATLSLEFAASDDESTKVVDLPTGAIEGRVREPDGRPAAGARVTLKPAAPPGPGTREGLRVSDASTRVADVAGGLRWGNVPPGAYALEARLPDTDAVVTAVVEVGERAVEVNLRAAEPAEIRVRVRWEDGRAAADVPVGVQHLEAHLVEAGWSRATDRTTQGQRTDAEGRVTITGLPEGLARVYAWVMPAGAWSATHNASAEVPVRPGEPRDVELTLRPIPP